MSWDGYQRLDVIDGYLRYLVSTYPQTVRCFSIGLSSQRRPLKVLRIFSGSSARDKPALWIDGGSLFQVQSKPSERGKVIGFYG